MPSNFGTLVKHIQTYHSEVAASGIARFTSTRLCCSQVLLIQNLFEVAHVDKLLHHQLLLVGDLTPILVLRLSGLSSISCLTVVKLLPRTCLLY